MRGAELAAHIVGIAHGVAAAVAVAAILHLAGLALLPRRPAPSLRRGDGPGLLGAAAFVLVCWIGIARGVPLVYLAGGFAGATVALAAVRARAVVPMVRESLGTGALRWLLAFCLFYLLSYVFVVPPVLPASLPVAWMGNIDVLTYIRFTQHVLRLAPWNVVGQDPMYVDYVYKQTPAVFYLMGAMSAFFRLDPLSAAMPVAFACCAVLGKTVARAARTIFGLPRWTAWTVGAVLIAGPFFRYLRGEYFLSTLMSLPVAISLVCATVATAPARRFDAPLAVRCAAAYVLLLFLYPLLFYVSVAVQAGAIVLMLIAEATGEAAVDRWRHARSTAWARAVSAGIPLLALSAVLFTRVRWTIEEASFLSRAGVAGWPLNLISPLAILGAPLSATDNIQCATCMGVELRDASMVPWAAALLALLVVGLLAASWLTRRTAPAAARTLMVVSAGAFVVYGAFYLSAGPTYQQWKFASYTALPWSFVPIALLFWLARRRSAERPLASGALAAALAVVLVVGNLVAHGLSDTPLVTLDGSLRNIAAVDAMPGFSEISIAMDETGGQFNTWMGLYFLPSKRVHVVSDSFEPREALSLESISPQHPLLIHHYGCLGLGHGDTREVPDVGCLTFGPPSVALDTAYPFKQAYMFIDAEGLAAREHDGRWNERPEVALRLTADVARVGVLEEAYVNLKVTPFLPPGTTQQRLALLWGKDRRAVVSLGGPSVISLPVGHGDWSGARIWTLPIRVALPDSVAPPPLYAPRGHVGDTPIGLRFEELSVSRQPGGERVPAGSVAQSAH
jgi:hypothetical protein